MLGDPPLSPLFEGKARVSARMVIFAKNPEPKLQRFAADFESLNYEI